MKKKKVRRFLGLLAVSMFLGITVSDRAYAQEDRYRQELGGELAPMEEVVGNQSSYVNDNVLISNNQGDNGYTWYWSSCMNSYLTLNSDGTYTRVEYANNGKVYVENYDVNFNLLSYRTVDAELPLFGGFYDDGTYYYLVFGQMNYDENNSVEVFRIVKYSKNWERLGDANVYGANTTVPFDAGNLRMDAEGGYLYVRTCHEMYTSSDGLNHQANVTMKINISDMSVEDIAYTVQNSGVGYVSHSFNQFIKADNGTVYALDHGDYYPRSAVLFQYHNTDFGTWNCDVSAVETIEYALTNKHYNYTGATLGGFEVSETSVLTAGSSTPQDGTSDYYNIYITATSKDNFTESGTVFKWITNYTNSSQQVGNPQLVEINKNAYLLMWTESRNVLKYVLLDGAGNLLSDIKSKSGSLSDCQPIYDPNTKRVVWYVTDGRMLAFCAIDTKTLVWPFTDVEVRTGNWQYESIKFVSDNNIMTGVDEDSFDPDASLTRGMFATVLYRMAGSPVVNSQNPFKDVYPGKWYTNAVVWAYENGIVSGFDGGTRFGVNENITREQIAKMLKVYADRCGYNTQDRAGLESFADAKNVSGWAAEYMQWAVGCGMISGVKEDGVYYLNPKGDAQRDECAAMLTRFIKEYER